VRKGSMYTIDNAQNVGQKTGKENKKKDSRLIKELTYVDKTGKGEAQGATHYESGGAEK